MTFEIVFNQQLFEGFEGFFFIEMLLLYKIFKKQKNAI